MTFKIYKSESLSPYENLATEKYLTTHLGEGEVILFLWRNADTIVIGRNQNVWQECRVSEFLESGGRIARRPSGGGAVYHDVGNLNFSFIYADGAWSTEKGLDVIAKACLPFGIKAEVSGRNDILVSGSKFSGNAFYSMDGEYGVKGVCHHGCILISADTSRLAKFLTVSKAKLESKGVRSVSSRVVNLGSISDEVSVEALSESLAVAFAADFPVLTAPTNGEIEKETEVFSSSEWIFGRKIDFTHSFGERFPWGEINLCFKVSGGNITECKVYSDSMNEALAPTVEAAFKDKPFSHAALSASLPEDMPEAGDIKGLIYRNI